MGNDVPAEGLLFFCTVTGRCQQPDTVATSFISQHSAESGSHKYQKQELDGLVMDGKGRTDGN